MFDFEDISFKGIGSILFLKNVLEKQLQKNLYK
jgi:hypothetical protein